MPGPGRKLVDPRREPRRGDDLGPDDIPDEGAEVEQEETHRRAAEEEEMPTEESVPPERIREEDMGEDEDEIAAGLPAPGDEDDVDVNVAAEFENDAASPTPESGLSVEPEDLGTHWLNTATEQGNFESSYHDDHGMRIVRVPIKAP